METKSLLYGLIGFFMGGLLVSVAATTFDKPAATEMTMESMTTELRAKSGDEYDKAFIDYMIAHHQAAVDMAKLSASNTERPEIKQLSQAIVTAQQGEILTMKQWQEKWGFVESSTHEMMMH